MSIKSAVFVKSLVKFLLEEIDREKIEFLVPLESKGALLVDLAMEAFPARANVPKILYLRALQYVPKNVRQKAIFAVFDDFAFTGRTIKNALDLMRELDIPSENVRAMAFFKFARPEVTDEDCMKVLRRTKTPSDKNLAEFSQEEVLRYVQKLAMEHKIPSSYDNLHWVIGIEKGQYEALMDELSKTGWYLHYGRRGKFDASALIVEENSVKSFFSVPKVRFWYNEEHFVLHVSPISYPRSGEGGNSSEVEKVKRILVPDGATVRQLNFALSQAEAITEQVALLRFVKPLLKSYGVTARLDHIQIERYFGPRAQQVIEYIEERYQELEDMAISTKRVVIPRRLDFYWVAVEIMRSLGKAYWTQKTPIMESKGFTVSELIERFAGRSSVEAVHAAVDYCADMNFIATFQGWQGDNPIRAFRLSENGEGEVGRNDGKQPQKLTFVDKLGALILAKSKNHEAYWWLLEKVPAILMLRFGFEFPEFEASMNFYGDTLKLRISEENMTSMTWREYGSELWEKDEETVKETGEKALVFKLREQIFHEREQEIVHDERIVAVMGALDTILELTKSKLKGHSVAILVDILSDGLSGGSYLENSLCRAVDLIEQRSRLAELAEGDKISEVIDEWFKGIEEKTELLSKGQERLMNHVQRTVQALTKQRREHLATLLLECKPFPANNRIVAGFIALAKALKRVDHAARIGNEEIMKEVVRELNFGEVRSGDGDYEAPFTQSLRNVRRWAGALSGVDKKTQFYNKYRLKVMENERLEMYIVTYDLMGSSGEDYAGRKGSERDVRVQAIINNWFIAFGGFAQRQEFAEGDLGFGFFHSLQNAIRASLWAGYHLRLLGECSHTFRQSKPHAGFAIVRDELNHGYDNQVRSDWLNKSAKAWKREGKVIAEKAGRGNLPIVAVHADLYSGVHDVPDEWFGTDDVLDAIHVRYIKANAMAELPWKV